MNIIPITKGPIEATLAVMEQGHYPPQVEDHLKAIGFTKLPAKMSLPRDAVLAEYAHVIRQHSDHTQDQAIARAIARVAWKNHAAPKAKRRLDRGRELLWVWRIALLLGVLAILGLLLARSAKAQVDVIKFKDSGGATIKTFAAPFTIQCFTNLSCSATGSTLQISASSTASAAWSSLTAGANANVGTFSASGNTWDFSGSTLFKLRVGTGCTTSANGDSCHDSTTGRWHFWVNGADRLFIGLTNVGVAGQVPISNADGTASFADPIVSPNQDTASTAAWTSVTALNTVLSVAVSQRSTVTVSFNGSSITGGAVTFEVSPDNTTWYTKAGVRGDATAFETTYALTGANQSWTFAVGGYTNFRVRLSTVITGAGTANINIIPQALGSPNLAAALAQITSALPTGANTIGGVNLTQYTPVAGRLPVDGSGVTQPVSAASLPLPTGAATAAKQPALGTAGTPSADVISVQGVTGMTAVKVDGSAVTQPVSGTVTANAGTGTFTVGQTTGTNLHMVCDSGCSAAGAFTDNTAFTAGTTSETNVGGVFNDGLAAVTSGNAAAARITTNRAVHANLRNNAGTEIGTSATPVRIDPTGTTTQPVSGTVTANIGTTNGLALDASVNGILNAQASTTSGQKGPLGQCAVTTSAPIYTTAQTDPLSCTTSGGLRVDGTASDNSANSTAKQSVIPARANATAPTWTEGNQVPLSVDLSGSARIICISGCGTPTQAQTYNATAAGVASAGSKDYINVFNATGSGKVLKITSIIVAQANTAAVTGVYASFAINRTSSAGATCTSITINKVDSSNAAVPAQVTSGTNCTTDPTISFQLGACSVGSDEGTGTASLQTLCYTFNNNGGQPWTLREGEGIDMVTTALAPGGVLTVSLEFTM